MSNPTGPLNLNIIRNAEDATAAATRRNKTSTWMLNIGTHRKPYDDAEYQLYFDSLDNALSNLFANDDWATDFLYAIRIDPATERVTELDALPWRNNDVMKIVDFNGDAVIERGKMGRIDAHILLHVIHKDSLLRVDINNFADTLQAELEDQNEKMAANIGIYHRRKPGYEQEPLQWPTEGRPYVTFSLIFRFNDSFATAYMAKQFYRNGRNYPGEQTALNTLTPIVSDMVNSKPEGRRTAEYYSARASRYR